MNRKKPKQWLLAFLTCLLLVAGAPGGWTPAVQAEVPVQLGVTAGIGGDYKETGMVPIQVTVSNSGSDVEGNLVVNVSNRGGDSFSVAYYQPVSVAKGATKQVTLSVPGNQIGPNTYVAFMQGDNIVAKTSIGGRRYSGDALFVGVLAANPDTANFLGAMPREAFNNQVRVLPLKAEQMPVASTDLQMIDILLLNNFALDSLNSQQVQAIREWTTAGGMLMLAGGAHYGKTAGELKELSPVEVTGVTSLTSLQALTVEKTNAPALDRPFTVSTGALKSGTALYTEAGVPLLATRAVGNGKVMYIAYDLTEEPVASWSGNSRFWADALKKGFGSNLNQTHRDPMDSVWALDNAADRIPALKMPDMKWLALFFGIYAFVAGPILFFLLRRKRKQGLMWGGVPALAVVTGIGIFTFGALQRGTTPLLHQVGFVEMLGDGKASAKAVTAMFVPSSSDYEIVVKGNGRTWPILPYQYGQEEPKAWVSTQPDQAQVQFKDVEFWSMRKVGTDQHLSDVGTFESDLVFTNGALKGTVTNKSPYSLRNVVVAADNQTQSFPELAPGQSIQVELKFDPSSQTVTGRGRSSARLFLPSPYQGNYNPEPSREEMMVDILEDRPRFQKNAPVMLVGWMDAPVVEMDMKGSPFKPYSISLVTAPLSIKPSPDGYVYYPTSAFDAVKTGSSTEVDDVGDGYMMRAGDITLEFETKAQNKSLQVEKVNLYTWSDDNTPFDKQVYNWKTQTFDPLDKAFVKNVMTKDKTADYLSVEGTLRIKFSHSFEDHRHLGTPVISVEGKVIKP
ncbi:DUF7408 domain-containing protein [Brevibacillus borstelensis]